MFENIPRLHRRLLAWAVDGDTEWGEFDWHGTHRDGLAFTRREVVIATIRDSLIAAARLYMEPTEVGGSDIDTVVQELSAPRASD